MQGFVPGFEDTQECPSHHLSVAMSSELTYDKVLFQKPLPAAAYTSHHSLHLPQSSNVDLPVIRFDELSTLKHASIPDYEGDSRLLKAAEAGMLTKCSQLLWEGLPVDQIKNGWSALHHSIYNGHEVSSIYNPPR